MEKGWMSCKSVTVMQNYSKFESHRPFPELNKACLGKQLKIRILLLHCSVTQAAGAFTAKSLKSPSKAVFLARMRTVLLSHTINSSVQAEVWLMLRRLGRETKIFFLPGKKKKRFKKMHQSTLYLGNRLLGQKNFEDSHCWLK